jgi:hypothetical protein
MQGGVPSFSSKKHVSLAVVDRPRELEARRRWFPNLIRKKAESRPGYVSSTFRREVGKESIWGAVRAWFGGMNGMRRLGKLLRRTRTRTYHMIEEERWMAPFC